MKKLFFIVTIMTMVACGANIDPDIISAEGYIKDKLKDPDSAVFKDVVKYKTGKNGYAVCGELNSKNSYGGFTGFSKFLVASKYMVMLREGTDINIELFDHFSEIYCKDNEVDPLKTPG